MNLIPSILEKTKNGERIYDIYSKMLEDRIIFLSEEIDDINANNIISQLLYLDSKGCDDIYLYINCPGGSITSGMAIYDTMNYIKSDVSTICIGMSASMASILLANGTKGKRYILPNSEVMIHQPLGGATGQASEIKIVADRIIYLRNKLNKILADKTGKDIKQIEKDTDRDYYLSAEEAIKYGLVDSILKRA